MHKIAFVVFISMFLAGNCDHHHDSKDHHHGKPGTLELNQGKRWQADEPTKTGFAKFKEDLSKYEKEKKGKFALKDYQEISKKSKENIDSIFASCKMTGKSHEELHKYIALLIEDIQPMKEIDLKKSEDSFIKLKSDLEKFSDFFE